MPEPAWLAWTLCGVFGFFSFAAMAITCYAGRQRRRRSP